MPPFASSRSKVLPALLLLLSGAGSSLSSCSASDPGSSASRQDFEGRNFFEDDLGLEGAGGSDDVSGLVDGKAGGNDGPISSGDACVIERGTAELVEQPVDIIFVLDNSGSMDDELTAVEENINLNFASILIASEVDYRVILISRHREEPRADSESASTSVCVTSPLSNLTDCESAGSGPSFSERFRQYSTKIESDDSFDVLLDTYLPPFEDGDREEKYDNAPLGWSEWLRPEAKQVFLEVTDDDEDMSVDAFLNELTALAPEHFGTGRDDLRFVFHSIVGLAEKDPPTAAYLPDEPLVSEECTGNDGDVTSSGTTYQELSRLTGGLRFPLCQFDAYDVVFRRIAEDVVETSTIACDFAIPPAPGTSTLDLDKVAISYTPGDGSDTRQFGQAASAVGCQADAFYIANDRVNLCPEACTTVRRDPSASVEVLFTCESQLIVPR